MSVYALCRMLRRICMFNAVPYCSSQVSNPFWRTFILLLCHQLHKTRKSKYLISSLFLNFSVYNAFSKQKRLEKTRQKVQVPFVFRQVSRNPRGFGAFMWMFRKSLLLCVCRELILYHFFKKQIHPFICLLGTVCSVLLSLMMIYIYFLYFVQAHGLA